MKQEMERIMLRAESAKAAGQHTYYKLLIRKYKEMEKEYLVLRKHGAKGKNT